MKNIIKHAKILGQLHLPDRTKHILACLDLDLDLVQVCQAILAEFRDEYLNCPCNPEEWKRVEEKFQTR